MSQNNLRILKIWLLFFLLLPSSITWAAEPAKPTLILTSLHPFIGEKGIRGFDPYYKGGALLRASGIFDIEQSIIEINNNVTMKHYRDGLINSDVILISTHCDSIKNVRSGVNIPYGGEQPIIRNGIEYEVTRSIPDFSKFDDNDRYDYNNNLVIFAQDELLFPDWLYWWSSEKYGFTFQEAHTFRLPTGFFRHYLKQRQSNSELLFFAGWCYSGSNDNSGNNPFFYDVDNITYVAFNGEIHYDNMADISKLFFSKMLEGATAGEAFDAVKNSRIREREMFVFSGNRDHVLIRRNASIKKGNDPSGFNEVLDSAPRYHNEYLVEEAAEVDFNNLYNVFINSMYSVNTSPINRLETKLKDFVRNGGVLYATGDSYPIAHEMSIEAGIGLTFLEERPSNIRDSAGGWTELTLLGDLKQKVGLETIVGRYVCYKDGDGPLVNELGKAKLLAMGRVQYQVYRNGILDIEERMHPVAFSFPYGDGTVYYSSYNILQGVMQDAANRKLLAEAMVSLPLMETEYIRYLRENGLNKNDITFQAYYTLKELNSDESIPSTTNGDFSVMVSEGCDVPFIVSGDFSVLISIRDASLGTTDYQITSIDINSQLWTATLKTPSGEIYQTKSTTDNSMIFNVFTVDKQDGDWSIRIDDYQNFLDNQIVIILVSDKILGSEQPIQTPVTGITLIPTSLNLEIDVSYDLTATVAPANATNKKVIWTSSNSNVAFVENGIVIAESEGNAEIRATTEDGGYTAKTIVNVEGGFIPISNIFVDSPILDLEEGQQALLSVSFTPVAATNKTVTWHTSDASVVTVNNGEVTAHREGIATITATSVGGEKMTYSVIIVTMKDAAVAVTRVEVSPTTLSLIPGGTGNLTVNISPTDATDKSVTWSSSNTALATVNSSGVVTAVSPGIAIITARSNNNTSVTATCNVTVIPATVVVTGITVYPTSATVDVGKTIDLSLTITPPNATNTSVTWSSNNTVVATVNASGVVNALSAGTATITARSNSNTSVSDSCTITVTEPEGCNAMGYEYLVFSILGAVLLVFKRKNLKDKETF